MVVFGLGCATAFLPVVGALPWAGWVLALLLIGWAVYEVLCKWHSTRR